MLACRSVYMFQGVDLLISGETNSHTPYPVHRMVAPCGHFDEIIEAGQVLWKAMIPRSQKQAAINMGACFKNNRIVRIG